MMISLIFVIVFFAVLYLLYDMVTTKYYAKKFTLSKKIKKTYEKLKVPTNEIIILTRDYFEEEDSDSMAAKITLYPLYDQSRPEIKQKFISILTYNNFICNGRTYIFKSVPINMSNTELKEIFKKEESIDIYYDKTDLTNYYFDLTILASVAAAM